MPSNKKLFQYCIYCNGSGKNVVSVNHGGTPPVIGPETEEISCLYCGGDGYKEFGYMDMSE